LNVEPPPAGHSGPELLRKHAEVQRTKGKGFIAIRPVSIDRKEVGTHSCPGGNSARSRMGALTGGWTQK